MEHMPELLKAMGIMIQTFDKYAAVEGKKDTLTKAEAKTLLEKELPDFIQAAKELDIVDEVLKKLDCDGDSEIDFREFVTNVAIISFAQHSTCGKK